MELSTCCGSACNGIAVAKSTFFGYHSGARWNVDCDAVHYATGLHGRATQQSGTYLSPARCDARLLLGSAPCCGCNDSPTGLCLLLLYLTEKQPEASHCAKHDATGDISSRHRLHAGPGTTCSSTSLAGRT